MKTNPTEDNIYLPIDCNYYDRLEAWAVKKETVEIRFMKEAKESSTESEIDDLFVKNSAEYIKLSNGEVIRLDKILSVDDIPLYPM